MNLYEIEEKLKSINEKRRISFTKEDFYQAVDIAASNVMIKYKFPVETKEMLQDFSKIFYSTYYDDTNVVSTTVYLLEKTFASAMTCVSTVLKGHEPIIYEFMANLHNELVPEMPEEIKNIRNEVINKKGSDYESS